MGDHIRSEDGVWTAVNAFHKYLDKAKLPQRLAKDKEPAQPKAQDISPNAKGV